MMFDSSPWIDRLHDDEALTDNLDDDQAERLLSWGESRLAGCTSDADAERVLAALREINRRAGKGEDPAPLIAALGRPEEAPATTNAAPDARAHHARKPERQEPESGEQRPDDERPSTENNQRPSSTS